jgi:hypothetical protein
MKIKAMRGRRSYHHGFEKFDSIINIRALISHMHDSFEQHLSFLGKHSNESRFLFKMKL